MNRKEFIKTTAIAVGGIVVASNAFGIPKLYSDRMVFELPKLPYSYDALNPFIDKETMEIHHSKHHQGYVNKLNNALQGITANFTSLDDILKNISQYSTALQNNAGGHYNHSLFWTILTPNKNSKPSEKLLSQINKQFGSLENLINSINKAATSRFGSGWAWLCDVGGKLEVCSSANQDNHLMPGVGCGGNPILGLDVWEHAYYLNYQNRRPDYITAFFNVVDWEAVASRFNG